MPMRIVTNKIIVLSPKRPPVIVSSTTQQKFSEGRVKRSMLRMLQENALCSIATVTKNNRAHINHAYFCYSDELELYFLSDPGSLHCQNLLMNSSMAMTIFVSSQKWGDSNRGIQLLGSCREVKGQQEMKAERLYGERFLPYKKWKAKQSGDDQFRYRFYRFVPGKIKVLDESEFGEGVFVIATISRTRESK